MTPSDEVATRARTLRRQQHLTVAQLAHRCAQLGAADLTVQALYNLEGGRRDQQGRRTGRRRSVSVDELLILASALGVRPAELLPALAEQPDSQRGVRIQRRRNPQTGGWDVTVTVSSALAVADAATPTVAGDT